MLFGSDLKEVSWRDGKMPPAGTKLCVAPQAPAGWRWTLHPAGLHPDVYAAAAARDSAEDVRNAALEEAAAHRKQEARRDNRPSRSGVRRRSAHPQVHPAPTAAEGSEDDMLTIAYLAGMGREGTRRGCIAG